MTLDTIFQPNVPSMIVGQKAYLDANIRCGLFEGSRGNRYLVGWDTGVKFAVALTHHDLPAFTTQDLNRNAIDYGRWWGPCRLRLTSAEEGDTPDQQPGKVGVGDQNAILLCRSLTGRANWMPLGYVGRTGRYFRDYDGWALETVQGGFRFFERSPTAHINLGAMELTWECSG